MFHALSCEYNMSGYILSPEHTAHLSSAYFAHCTISIRSLCILLGIYESNLVCTLSFAALYNFITGYHLFSLYFPPIFFEEIFPNHFRELTSCPDTCRFIPVKLADIRKEVQCPICLGNCKHADKLVTFCITQGCHFIWLDF